jgi:hypothetical protein
MMKEIESRWLVKILDDNSSENPDSNYRIGSQKIRLGIVWTEKSTLQPIFVKK